MKKARLFGLALVGAVALMAGCANDEAATCSDSACSAEKAACASSCSTDKAAGATGEGSCSDKAASGCCKEKAPAAAN